MKRYIFLTAGLLALLPNMILGDTGDFPTAWPGCRSGEEKVACISEYDKGCELYINNPEYYIGRAEKHGVIMNYEFCKGTPPSQGENQRNTLLAIGGLVALASIGAILFLKLKRHPLAGK